MLAWIRVDALRNEGGLEECYRKSHTLDAQERSADCIDSILHSYLSNHPENTLGSYTKC